jgi:hypothetical protein
LKHVGAVAEPLRQLADALQAVSDREKRQAIINARANSEAFVAGLYVDLYDFCDRLLSKLDSPRVNDPALISACQKLREAIQRRDNHALIMANEVSKNEHCHGISIYFPYLTISARGTTNEPIERGVHVRRHNGSEAEERGRIEAGTRGGIKFSGRGGIDPQNQSGARTTTRGGTGPLSKGFISALNKGFIGALNKGFIGALNKGFIDAFNKERRQRIEETEQYYPQLKLSAGTCWSKFIRHCWSRWLVEDAEEKARRAEATETSEILNQHYSAQQCALNLLSLCRELETKPTDRCRVGGEKNLEEQGKRVPVNRRFR